MTYSLNPSVILDAEYMRLTFSDSADKAAMFVVRGTYLLSKRTAIYATAGRIDTDGGLALSVSRGAPGSDPAAGAGQNAVAMGRSSRLLSG